MYIYVLVKGEVNACYNLHVLLFNNMFFNMKHVTCIAPHKSIFNLQVMSSSMPKVSPTESFLRYLALPEDESEFVELQHCAVVLVSHLDRLAAPYLPVSSNQKVRSHLSLYSLTHIDTHALINCIIPHC